jgi:hypothetical protein
VFFLIFLLRTVKHKEVQGHFDRSIVKCRHSGGDAVLKVTSKGHLQVACRCSAPVNLVRSPVLPDYSIFVSSPKIDAHTPRICTCSLM